MDGIINNPAYKRTVLIVLTFLMAVWIQTLSGQEWELNKDKDGIRVYSRQETESNIRSFKGETDIQAEMTDISTFIEDVEKFNAWDENVEEIRLLAKDPGKMLKYYVVYNLPWPFQNRDLCVEAFISADQDSNTRVIQAASIPEEVPLNDNRVRIRKYWQKWKLERRENGIVHIVLEGFADPAGDIPAWIANLAITDTPMNILKAVRKRFTSD